MDLVNVDGIPIIQHQFGARLMSEAPLVPSRSKFSSPKISQHLSGVQKTLLENFSIGLVGPSPRCGSFPWPAVGVRSNCPIPFRRVCLRSTVGASIFATRECFERLAAVVRSTTELHPFHIWVIDGSGSGNGPVLKIPSIGRSRVHPGRPTIVNPHTAELVAQPHRAPLHCRLL